MTTLSFEGIKIIVMHEKSEKLIKYTLIYVNKYKSVYTSLLETINRMRSESLVPNPAIEL